MSINTEPTETQDDIEYRRLRMEVKKMIVDMEHDVSQREHWKETRQAQSAHWKRQQYCWVGTVIMTSIALIASPFILAYASKFFN